MTKKILISAFIILFSICSFGQNRYKVFFTDKNNVSFSPYQYFDTKAIERRLKSGISLYDETDYPLNRDYVNSVAEIADKVTTEIRWFNLIFVKADDNQILEIEKLSFVKRVEPVFMTSTLAEFEFDTTLSEDENILLKRQLSVMGGDLFEQNKIDGTGIRIAVFDGGFPNVDVSPVFEHIRKRSGILKTYDFTKKKEFVYSYNSHGTMVLSCIAGMNGDKKIGLATGAEFLLARTEVNREPFSEEENWLAAVEWADKNGADIINSSLGYTKDRYFPNDMDGKKSLVSRAATLAARKGILVVNAIGNDGSDKWKVLGAPADADSILSIGGIDPKTNYHQNFSSYGPTVDFRMKPNICAFSTAIVGGKEKLKTAQGTSFASPLIAGFAACAWQTEKSLNNMEMLDKIQKSGNLYPYFDYAHGYGVPQAHYFFPEEYSIEREMRFSIAKKGDEILIKVFKDYIDTTENAENYLYYKISNPQGVIVKYFLINVENEDAARINISDWKGNTLQVFYKGFYLSKEI